MVTYIRNGLPSSHSQGAMFFNNLSCLMLSFLPFTEAGTNLTQETVSEDS